MNLRNYLNVSSDKPNIPFIVGPTASGKTDLAIKLAQDLDTEIISADSMAIYKEMDIGTAKPTIEEQKLVKHHMIDFLSPDEPYSVADYYQDSSKIISSFLENDKVPIICGGTGLYINALTLPYSLDKENTDEQIRKELEEISKTQSGKAELYKELLKVDPESAKIIHPNNVKRVIRALEIFKVTGRKKSDFDREGKSKELDYNPIILMPDYPREILYDRIDQRVDKMIDLGLIDEVKKLDQKYDRSLPSMQAIGYKEFFDYFDGKIDKDEAIRILKRNTRHFAKRQLTWFRKDSRIQKFSN